MCASVGATMSKVIVVPPPVTITCRAVSGAVKTTATPFAAESLPAVAVQAAAPGECVSLTSSPTPTLRRVRGAGDVSTVSLVIVSAGAGAGGAGAGGGGDGGAIRGSLVIMA